MPSEHEGTIPPNIASDAEALYRQGMADYRLRRWRQAKECFERLRALDPERRGVDGLINELDHFITLDGVRPGAPAAGATVMVADRPVGARAPRRIWMLTAPILLVVLILAAVAVAGTGIFAQGATPSPSAVPQVALLTARAASGQLRIAAAGNESWQDWGNGRLLTMHDRIQTPDQGAFELTLADGKVSVSIVKDTMMEVERIVSGGEAVMRQNSGAATVQANSRFFRLATAFLSTQATGGAATYRVNAGEQFTYIAVDNGQVEVTFGDKTIVVAAGEELKVAPNQPLTLQRQGAPAATPTSGAAQLPTATTTPTVTATATSTLAPSPTATATAIPATATPFRSATPTPPPPSPTATVVAPAATATSIPVAPPTNTPPPPTNTPAPPTHTPAPPPPTPTRPR